MSKIVPLINVFKADPSASVVPVEIPGLSLPPVTSANLLNDPEYRLVEGRGTYEKIRGLKDAATEERVTYAKGSGNAESKRSEVESDPRRFTQFGHSSLEQYCFGSAPSEALNSMTGPRVRGALALPHAVGEVVNAAVFLTVMMKKEGIPSIEAAEAKGLTVPEGAVFSPAISADICDGLSRVSVSLYGSAPKEPLDFTYGVASLRVPATERLRTRGDVTESKGDFWSRILRSDEKMAMVGRVLKHQLACGFVSLSTHLQNIYDAPHSLCPHADSSDLVPISEILREAQALKFDQEEVLEGLVMRQLQYLPFNLMRYDDYPPIQQDARAAIDKILCTIAPDAFSSSERRSFANDFMRKPYGVLSSIANRLIDTGMVLTEPQVDWQRLRDAHSNIAYDMVSEQMISLALDGACKFSSAIVKAQRSGGLRREKAHEPSDPRRRR